MTCVGAPKGEIDEVVARYHEIGVRHIVALRGDPTTGIGTAYHAHPDGYQSSPDLIEGIKKRFPDIEISVSAYPSGLRLIEQTSIGGTFVVYSSATPTGPWHAFYSGTLPGCSTTPKGFCYAFVGHPELGTNSSLVISYFKPDSPTNVDIGHVDLALVPLPH